MTLSPLEWCRDEHGWGGVDWPRVLLIALSATVLVGLFAAAATSTAAFGPYNPSWDGTSELHDQVNAEPGVESELVRETTQYEAHDPSETVAIVTAPDDPYEGADAERVETFVANGGTLVVLENFGTTGNDLLANVGATARADGELLRDEREYYRGPSMPVATGIAEHTYTDGVEQLTLNYASAVEPGAATVLVETSESAYRDTNRDGELSDGEEPNAYPVATVEPVSEGQVVVVGDPSVAINAMIEEPDNAAFLRAIYTDSDQVLIDLSHSAELPPLASATLTLRESALLQVLVGALGIGAISMGSRRRLRPALERVGSRIRTLWAQVTGRGSRTRGGLGHDSDGDPVAAPVLELDDEQRAAVLRERYPEWDDQRIQRVIAALNRPGSERGDDE